MFIMLRAQESCEFKTAQELRVPQQSPCDYLKITAERKAKKSKYDLRNKESRVTLKRNPTLIHEVLTEIFRTR